MAGGNFMHRVVSYLVNEIVVNGLANRFAVRASKRLEEVSNVAAQKRREVAETMKDITEEIEESVKACSAERCTGLLTR